MVSHLLSFCGYQIRKFEVFKKRGFVQFTTKAFNGRVVAEWLNGCLSDAQSRPDEFTDPDGELPLLSACMRFGLEGLVWVIY